MKDTGVGAALKLMSGREVDFAEPTHIEKIRLPNFLKKIEKNISDKLFGKIKSR